MDSRNRESPRITHSTVIKDIQRNGPRKNVSSGGRFALDTSKRIYDRGPRSLKLQIADSQNSADLRFPAFNAFFTGMVRDWFDLSMISFEAVRDASLSLVLLPEKNFAELRKTKPKP